MFEALLFDFDGTIADTERDGHRVAYNQTFEEMGLDWHWDVKVYGRLLSITGGKERMRYFIREFAPQLGMQKVPDSLVEEIYRAKSNNFKGLIGSGAMELRPGIMRILNEARQRHIRLAVVTTTFENNVRVLLDKYLPGGVDDWFELIAAGDIVEHKKPAPDIYQWAMNKMGLSPSQCVAVEDSRNGLLSAVQADIRSTIITYSGYTQNERFDEACLVVDHLGQKGQPTRVKRGNIGAKEMVDVDVIHSLHRLNYPE